MRENDILAMPEIYYAGGSATRDVSSNDLIQPVTESGKQAYFFDNRDQIREFFLKESRDGDRIVIMGARDDSLSDFAEGILTAL